MKFIILISSFSIFYLKSLAQNFDLKTDIKFSGIVKIIDSQFVLIPQLKIEKQGLEVKLPKYIYYSSGYNSFAECGLFFQKQLVMGYENISLDYLNQVKEMYAPDAYESIIFGEKSILTDTLYLKDLMPFEIGHHRVRMELKCYIHNEFNIISSDWIYFDVNFIPQNSMH